MSRRSEELRAVAGDFCRVHDEWEQAGKKRPTPDGAYWDAVEALIESFDSGDIHGDCRPLASAVDRLAEETKEFDDRDDPNNNNPHDKFWDARQAVADALVEQRKRKEQPPLESIAALKAQGCTDVQISKIYGFYTGDRDDRRYLTHLVQKELDKPGSVLNDPKGVDGKPWRNPNATDEAAGNEPAERHRAALAEKRKGKARTAKPCPESPLELWQQGVAPKQAAKMLCQPEAEVSKLFEAFEAEHEQKLRSGEKVGAVTQAIRERAAKGESAAQIAREMKLEIRKVTEALKEPAAAGA